MSEDENWMETDENDGWDTFEEVDEACDANKEVDINKIYLQGKSTPHF